MSILSNQKVKLFIEQPNGLLYELTAQVKSFSIDTHIGQYEVTAFGDRDRSFIPSLTKTDVTIELSGYDAGIWSTGNDMKNRMKSNEEWKCDYCGRPNERRRETCKSCGSIRSFVYG